MLLRATRPPREGWNDAFRLMADNEDDRLLDEDLLNATCWDEEEWQW
jgi:antitoxin MazE